MDIHNSYEYQMWSCMSISRMYTKRQELELGESQKSMGQIAWLLKNKRDSVSKKVKTKKWHMRLSPDICTCTEAHIRKNLGEKILVVNLPVLIKYDTKCQITKINFS